MKKTMIRVALLALAALLALSLVACGDDGDYKQFSINEEHTVITDGTNTYTLHELPRGFYRGPVLGETPVCQYKNPLEWEPHYAMDLSEPGGDSGILYATYYVALKDSYFATDEAEAELQAFFAGDYPQFALDSGNQHRPQMLVPAAQKDAILAGYAASTVTLDVDVTTLDALVFSSWFTLVATDKTGTFKTDIGAILVTEDGCYYVDFATLDNSHFDADGFFSFRSGTVTFKQLTGDAAAAANALIARFTGPDNGDLAPVLTEGTTPESIAAEAEAEDAASLVLFWALYIGAGFVLPGAGLALGLIFATRQKPHAHRWFIVVGIAGLWLLISAIVLLLLLL